VAAVAEGSAGKVGKAKGNSLRWEVEMYLKKYHEGKAEVRPECICYFILPAGKIGNLSAGVVEIEPGGRSFSCPHTAWRQVFFILDGKGYIQFDAKKRYPVKKDMVVEIPYDTEHKVVASKSGPLRYLFVNDYSQPVAKNARESTALYKKVAPLAKKDLRRGQAKMIEEIPPLSPARQKLAQRIKRRRKKK